MPGTKVHVALDAAVSTLRLRDGDTLVITTERGLDQDVANRIVYHMKETFPGHRIIVCDNGMKIGVVRPEGECG